MSEKRQIAGIDKTVFSGLMLVVAAALILEATNVVQSVYSQKGLMYEVSLRAQSEMDRTRSEIMDIVNQVETAVRNNVRTAQWSLNKPDSIPGIPRRIVADNPVISGSTLALVPDYNKKFKLYAPYCYRESGELRTSSLATKEYDYPSQQWFTMPIVLDDGYWSEPYFDEGGGNILMTTFSVPIKDANGYFAGVLTADLSLDWLSDVVSKMGHYEHSLNTITSRVGNVLVRTGELPDKKGDYYESTAKVERTGWIMNIVIPEKELYGSIHEVSLVIVLLQILGLGMLLLILRAVTKKQKEDQELRDQHERIQSELRIGHDIQMSMVPKSSTPFPDRKDLDFAAYMIPSEAVCGDLYDFFIRDEKLFFCIGDVSGKGVPASLVMAVTRSLFRAFSSTEDSPARIMTSMNKTMSESNDSDMFVTFFLGVLDLNDGHLRYCNAGHNPPFIFTNAILKLDVIPNMPLGVMPDTEFTEQETYMEYDDALFLYTEGVPEAENAAHEQFGEERMDKVLHTRRSAIEHLKAMHESLKEFTGDAPQSDDITMLFLHYLPYRKGSYEAMRLTMHNQVQEISKLEEFIETAASRKNLDPGLVASINLAIEEAVTNVILYAYPEGEDGLVDLDAIVKERSIEFVLSDSGAEFDPTAAPEADITLSVEDRPIGGLGIFLVRKIMDDVRYKRKDGKNILLMKKFI